jgi:hypothetical protein
MCIWVSKLRYNVLLGFGLSINSTRALYSSIGLVLCSTEFCCWQFS